MAITFNKKNNAYTANINGKQFSYSINKYGPLAKLLAEKSLKEAKRFKNYIINKKDYSILKIYSKQTNEIYDVKIDLDSVSEIEKHKWYIKYPENSKTLYVSADKIGFLHRFLMKETNKKIQIDHINRNGLDNRKINLRKVNQSINSKNTTVKSNNKVGINGVSYIKPSGNKSACWAAVWTDNNGQFHKKTFSLSKYENAFELAVNFRKQKEKENNYI